MWLFLYHFLLNIVFAEKVGRLSTIIKTILNKHTQYFSVLLISCFLPRLSMIERHYNGFQLWYRVPNFYFCILSVLFNFNWLEIENRGSADVGWRQSRVVSIMNGINYMYYSVKKSRKAVNKAWEVTNVMENFRSVSLQKALERENETWKQ